ncbi:hypothetical protein BaRGS_00026345 [Batillaria attramentaria]|uniref:Uncharacterized protein n=1 Tax=Batillaria attramentaria TaxID=370345 RepID=A0ABD0K6D7_9CAEN
MKFARLCNIHLNTPVIMPTNQLPARVSHFVIDVQLLLDLCSRNIYGSYNCGSIKYGMGKHDHYKLHVHTNLFSYTQNYSSLSKTCQHWTEPPGKQPSPLSQSSRLSASSPVLTNPIRSGSKRLVVHTQDREVWGPMTNTAAAA